MARAKKARRVEYSFRAGSPFPKDKAQTVGIALEDVQRTKGTLGIQPTDVVEAAVSPASPLHEFFEWDDTVAAQEYRVVQARHLLGAIKVTILDVTPEGQPMRLFLNLTPADGDDRAYIPAVTVLSDAAMRGQIVEQALAEAESWRRRYEHLDELRRIFDAIDATKARHRDRTRQVA